MDSIVLASSSPRRKDILGSLGIPFVSIHPEIDESIFDHEEPGARTVLLARAKAMEGAAKANALDIADLPGCSLVLGADTLVALRIEGRAGDMPADDEPPGNEDWEVLGKPEDREDAGRMTRRLAGRTHRVFTGIALVDRISGQTWTALSDSAVTFSDVDEDELQRYLDSGEWEGAAGAYKLQGLAACHIARIDGSWSGVMGLPIRELYDMLTAAKYRW